MTLLIQTDDRGVSPVIATILLVAITVILAAVLYVMVSGMFNPHNSTSKVLGVSESLTGNGGNWELTLVTAPSGVTQNDTTLTLIAANGSTALAPRTLFELEQVTDGVQYIPATYGPSVLNVGDRVVIAVLTYPVGTGYQFVSGGTVIAMGTLHS